MVTVTLNFDDETIAALEDAARQRGSSVNELLLDAAHFLVPGAGGYQLTEEQEQQLEAAHAEIERGEFVTKEDLFAKLKALRG